MSHRARSNSTTDARRSPSRTPLGTPALVGILAAILALAGLALVASPTTASPGAASDAPASVIDPFSTDSHEAYYQSPFVGELLGSETLAEIRAEHAEEEGFLTAVPMPGDISEASLDHVGLLYEGSAPADVTDEPPTDDRPAIRVYEDRGLEEQITFVSEDRIVDGEPQQAPSRVQPGPVEGIGPGSFLIVDRPDIDPPQVGVCTASFVAEDPAGNVYLTTAGHCVLEQGMDSFYDPGFSQEGTTVSVCRQPLFTSGTFFCLNGQVELGDIAYARQAAEDGTEIGRDFAAVEVPAPLLDEVRPWMWLWGGPTDVDDGPQLGEEVVHYGHGVLTGPTVPLEGRAGVSLGSSAASGSYLNLMAVTGGDSGSGVATSELRTEDRLVGDQAFGVLTHGIGVVPTGLPGIGWGITAEKGLALAEDEEGLTLDYVLEHERVVPADPQPPLAPENVTATDDSTADTARVHIAWDINGTSHPVYDVHIYRDGETIDTVPGTETEYVDDEGLQAGQTYCYRLQAENDEGTSALSEEVCLTPTLAPLAAPNFVRAIDRGTGDEIQLVWGNPGEAVAETFHVERILNNETVATFTTDGDNRSLLDDGLAKGVTYTYEVEASVGNETSDAVTATATPTQDAPEWRQARGSGAADAFTGAVGDVDEPAVLARADVAGPVDTEPKVADIDDDGENEIVVATDQSFPDANPNVAFVAFEVTEAGLEEKWRHTAPVGATVVEGFGHVAIADLDGDGSLEVAALSHYDSEVAYLTTLWALDGATGEVLDSVGTEHLNPAHDVPLRVLDTGDGIERVLVFDDNQYINTVDTRVLAFHLDDGSLIKDVQRTIGAESPQGAPALVDDPAGPPQLVASLGSRPAPGVTSGDDVLHHCEFVTDAALDVTCRKVGGLASFVYSLSTGYVDATSTPSVTAQTSSGVVLADLDASTMASTEPPEAAFNAPALADVNGSGTADIVSAAYNEYVNDVSRIGHVFAQGYNGSAFTQLGLAERSPPTGTSDEVPAGPVVADVDGDGGLDAIVADESGDVAAVSLSAMVEGSASPILWEISIGTEIRSSPALADVTGDGQLEIVVAATDGTLAVVDDGDAAAGTPGLLPGGAPPLP